MFMFSVEGLKEEFLGICGIVVVRDLGVPPYGPTSS